MPRQFYKVVTRRLPAIVRDLIEELSPYDLLATSPYAHPPEVAGIYPVDEHTLLYIYQDSSMKLSSLMIPREPISPVPQADVISAMMVNPTLDSELGQEYYEYIDEGTFSTIGEFGGEPARFIICPNERLLFTFYRLLNLGIVRPSPRTLQRRINLHPPDDIGRF